MTLARAISYMNAHGGGNYRIERNVRSERNTYTLHKKYDTNDDGVVTLLEYFKGISRPQPVHDPKSKQLATNVDALQNGADEVVRARAAFELGHTKDRCVVPALIKALRSDPHWEVRRHAVYALGRIGDPRAIPALGKALMDRSLPPRGYSLHDPSYNRVAAAEVLGDMRIKKAIPLLIKALSSDPNGAVRGSAAEALRKIGHRGAAHALIKALNDNYAQVRKQAALALGKMRIKKAVPALRTLLRDPDGDVSKAAHEALRNILG